MPPPARRWRQGERRASCFGNCPDYVQNLKSKVADYRLVAPDDLGADAPHAAALMSEFVDGRPWAHLEIANKEFATKDTALCPEGGSGYGVALFDAFLRQRE